MVSALLCLLPIGCATYVHEDASNLMQLKKSTKSAPDGYGTTTQGYGYGTTTATVPTCHCAPGNDGGYGDTCTLDANHDKAWCYVNADCPGAVSNGRFGQWSEEPCRGFVAPATTTMAPTTTTMAPTTTTMAPTTTTMAPTTTTTVAPTCHCAPGNDGGHGDTCTFGSHDKAWCYVNADCPGAVSNGRFGQWSEEPCRGFVAPAPKCPDQSEPNFIVEGRTFGGLPVKVAYGHVAGPSGMPFQVHGQFKASPDTPKFSGILDHVASGNHKDFAGWKIGLDDKHRLRLDVSQSTSYYQHAHSSQQHLADGKWHTFVCKVTKDYIQIEVDGELGKQYRVSEKHQKQTPPEFDNVVNTKDYVIGSESWDTSGSRLLQGEIKDLYLCGGEAPAPSPPAPPPARLTDHAGCPVCTCNSPSWWHPFNGCNIKCGAKCGNECCCISGVGSCP